MIPALWFRFAFRDLRSGLQGFWIFLTCLALGTAAIAVIGSLSAAVQRGLDEQGQPLLGGDVAFALIHREATAEELAFLHQAGTVSLAATLRAMAVAGDQTTLVELKAVDPLYPLYGKVTLAGNEDFSATIAPSGAAVADPLLLGRLGLKIGDQIKVGAAVITIAATITSEPDRISDGFVLGPRLLVSRATLDATGLVQPGSLITWNYRVKLAPPAAAAATTQLVEAAKAQFPDAGWRIRSRDNAAQGTDRFIERLGYFMTLVGIASLIVGGAGIANAVAAFVSRRMGEIATLKCLGAASRDIFGIFLIEILSVGLVAIALGVFAGALAPLIATSLLAGILPLPITAGVEWAPLAIAAALGLLATIAFAIWPLARTRSVPASALFRHRALPLQAWPRPTDLLTIAAALAAMTAIVFSRFDEPRITAWFLGGLAASFAVLLGLARLIVWGASGLPSPRSAISRYALANLHRPGAASASVIMALGLGLTLFVTLALTDQTISTELRSGIPAQAPAFFFLDVRDKEIDAFTASLAEDKAVTAINAAPMLRGRMVSVKGVPVEKVKADADSSWALRGDRGLSYADTLPEGSKLTEGQWWPKDYDGPPLVSMVTEVGRGMGLAIGDDITVNVLGREVSAKVASFRDVNWRSLGINFVMVFSPNTLKKAPHSYVVTVTMTGGDEAALLNRMAHAFPSVTAVRVKDAIEIVSDLLGKMLTAIRGANVMTLLTGVLVLAGALAAGLSGRLYEAVVLKTYGASRAQLVTAFALEYAALGLAAAIFGLAVGSLASWFLARFILEMPWHFSLLTAALTALIAMAVTVAAGLAVTWQALSARPSIYLRDE